MKLFATVVLVTGFVLGVAYIGGAFNAEVNVTINQEMKDDVAELTYDTIEKAQEKTDKVFETLKRKLEERDE